MPKRTTRGWEIRMRVGGGVRLECTAPGTLTELQAERRESLLEALRDDLLPLGDHEAIRHLLRGVAAAPTVEAAALQEKLARRFAKDEAKRVGSLPTQHQLMTFGKFALHWASGDFARANPDGGDPPGAETARVNIGRVACLNRTLGNIPLARVTLEDCKRAMKPENLPKHCKKRTSRRHYAQIIQTVLTCAISAGLITQQQYPLPHKGWLPTIETPPSHGIIYPNDDAMLMRGPVPIGRRMLYGFVIREGVRLSHALRLRKRNIDFANGMITVGRGKNNSNGRTWELNRGVAPALAEYLKDVPLDGYVFPRLTKNEMLDLAKQFRADLIASGVTEDIRPDLFASGDGQEPVRFQDQRQSFVALHMAMDWSEAKIILRTQHKSSQVLHKNYGQKAATARIIIAKQGPLLPLDEALGMTAAKVPQASSSANPARVGVEVGVEKRARKKSSTITSTPGRIRTYDQRIRNAPPRDQVLPEEQKHRSIARGGAPESVSPHPDHGGVGVETVPPLTLTKGDLTQALARAHADENWRLSGALTAQLEALAAATPDTGVISLDAARKRRDREGKP